MKWTPDAIGCLIVIAGGLGLRFAGIDGEVWTLILAAFGWLCKGQYDIRKEIKKAKVGGQNVSSKSIR